MKKDKRYKRVVDNKMRWQGDTDTEKKIIRVNKKKSKKKSSIIGTIVHEEDHAQHPNAHEKTVAKREDEIVKGLSKKEKARLYSWYR